MNTSFITMLSSAELPGRIIGFDAQLLWDLGMQLFSTFVIVVVMYIFLHKPVTAMIEKRKKSIADNIDEAKAAKARAIELKADYEEKLTKVEEEAAAILKEARAKALAREEQIIAEARKEAEAIKEKAANDIRLEQERVKDEMKTQMIDVASLMAGKFVATSIDEAKQNEIIDEVIKEMGDVQWLS